APKVSEVTCYAESKDGITWTKPNLGLFEFLRSKDNNIVWMGGKETHNFTPFKDKNPSAPEAERYKALAGYPLRAFISPDGIHWKLLREEPVITKGAFDSQNLAFWDTERQQYVAYFRDFIRPARIRAIKTCTSTDFRHWSDPVFLDYGDAPI